MRVMTEMASNQLIKDWIQYLKNNQIAAVKSDPTTGKLNYRRSPTADDLVNFLQIKTDYDDDTNNNAIESVVKTRSGSQVSKYNYQPEPDQTEQPSTQQKKYNTDDATDVEPRYDQRPALARPRTSLPAPTPTPPEPDQPQPKKRTGGKIKGELSQTPNAIRKRAARSRRGNITEEFTDDPGEDLSEKDIQAIFDILGKSTKSTQSNQSTRADAVPGNNKPEQKRIDPQQVRIEEVNKLKRVIRDTMTDQQRLSLWRALHND